MTDLDATPVFRNLTFRSSLFGFSAIDLGACVVPGTTVFLICTLAGVSSLWGLAVTASLALGVLVLKHMNKDFDLALMIERRFIR